MLRFIAVLSAAALLAPGVTAQEASREVTNISGDVYLFRNNFHNSLLVMTEGGVVRVDPINAEASAWVNDYLAGMDGAAVTHLIYSHSHLDHASGGAAHDGAEVIAHEDAPADIGGTVPTIRVGDSEVLEIGGKTIELTNLGGGHDSNMLAVVVRPENVAFVVDVVNVDRLPYQDFPGANVDGYIDQVDAVLGLDFEILAAGHGGLGGKADVQATLEYLKALRAGVLDGLKAGKSVDEITAELTLDAYSDWGQYQAWRPLNIAGMARYLQEAGLVN